MVVGAVDDLIADAVKKIRESPEEMERARRREAEAARVDEALTKRLKKGVAALLDKKAEKLVVLKLAELTSVADYFVLASATNDRQCKALADAVEETLRADGVRPLSVEGYESAHWILIDYGDIVFHVFLDEARRFYGLERLWGDAPETTETFVPARSR